MQPRTTSVITVWTTSLERGKSGTLEGSGGFKNRRIAENGNKIPMRNMKNQPAIMVLFYRLGADGTTICDRHRWFADTRAERCGFACAWLPPRARIAEGSAAFQM